jgi:predicted ATP-grasp superfamily ATP-dependent carboligase
LCQDGAIVAYTIQQGFVQGYSHFSAPTGIEYLYDSDTYEVVRRLMETLHWSGIAPLDLRYDEQAKCVKVIEINPRLWGSVLGPLTAGVNFPYLACLAGLQAKLPAMTYQCQRFVAGKAALRLLMPRWRRRQTPGVAFQHTGLRFIAHDPAHEE